ncbi:MAG: hypothetical protein JNM00_11440, partial [Flavobacteriales bacterium]|nr:hypothetical protein [Flavobacteriales bacterium]
MSKSIALTFLFLVGGVLSAQNLLDKRITVIAVDMKLGDVMHIIEERGQFSFSYGSKVIDETRTLTLRAEKRPVREILVKMFGDELKFKERGNYVILTKAPAGEKKYIDGYVEDSDGKPLANATLYDESSLLSANTNDYGYYRMKVPRRINTIQLSA